MQIDITPEYLASQGLSPTFPERFWSKVNKNGPIQKHCPELGPCWIWKASKVAGYGQIGRWKLNDTPMRSHRASWILHFGPIPKTHFVCHKCDNPSCVNPGHLFLGTPKDNTLDMMKKGRFVEGVRYKGSKNGNSVLTVAKVLQIRNLRLAGFSQQEISNKFSVAQTTISAVLRRETWKHI